MHLYGRIAEDQPAFVLGVVATAEAEVIKPEIEEKS